jgi:DNA-binding transcriptional ArsR family regulator
VSGPRDIIGALGRGGRCGAIIDHLAEHGPSSSADIGEAFSLTRPGARAHLIALRAGGVVDLEDDYVRVMIGSYRHRYFLDPDALRYAARWLDALAERAERANRAAAFVPLANGRTR